MSERPNKVSIGSVVFLDILHQSSKTADRRSRDKELFNRIIDEALGEVAVDERLLADTGDGAAIALLGAPEVALFVALTIRDAIARHNQASADKLLIRAGISMGPVKVGDDGNGATSLHGEGIHAAEQVRNLAGPNQILVSRAYYDITSGLTDEIDAMFSPVPGMQKVYAVRSLEQKGFVPASTPEPTPEPTMDALEFSRLLNEENPPRYGLWGSAALVALIVLVAGFMLLSHLLRPDLGVVIADSKPAKPVADVHKVATTEASPPPVAPRSHEVASNLEPVEPAPALTADASEPVPVPAAGQRPESQSLAKQSTQPKPTSAKLSPVNLQATPVETTSQTDVSEPAPIPDAEAEPETPPPASQEKPKKVATGSPVKRGPVVEERRLPPGKRMRTVWDEFKESFKQGRKERVCTQAEIALNQCQ
ncbi:MAG TPA: hypothetical protein VFS17_07990 [Methylophilaceae bacterium]|nr:hypothetical protein [Methylophilaceae bacterium]